MMDHLTALCVIRELIGYPDDDLFDLLESGALAQVLGRAEAVGRRDPPAEPLAWVERPSCLEEWQALYLASFEVGVPAPKSPLQETFYVDSSSAADVIRENYVYYRHFDCALADDPAPHDSLPKQLGFLAHLEALLQSPGISGDGKESLERARDDYVSRHLSWIPKLLERAKTKGVEPFYLRTLSALEGLLWPADARPGHGPHGTA